MAITLAEANAMVAKPQGLTIDQANAKIAPKPSTPWSPPPLSPNIEGTLQPLTGFLEQWQKNIQGGKDLLRQAKADISLTESDKLVAPLVNLRGIGEGALGLLSLMWSPAQTVVDQFAIKPTEALIKAGAEALPVKEDQDKPPGYDAAVRRGEKPPQWSKGVITRKDTDLQVENLNEFMGNLYSTVAGFIGGEGAVKPHIGKEALRDLSDADKKILGQSLTTNFDALAAKDPLAAKMVADHVGGDFGDKLNARIAKAQAKSPDKLKETGKDTIKPRVRVVGETAEGKPRVRVMTPEQISSGMRDAAKDAREGMSTPSINLAIRRDRSNVKSQKYNTGAYSEHEDPTMKQGEGAGDAQWTAFHQQVGPEVWAKLEEAFHAGVPLSTHEFLDTLLKADSPYKDIISHLRKHVEDVPIRPTMEDIVDRTGKQWPHNTPGLWDPVPREIHLRIDAQGPQRLQTALHEVVHAATSTFIHNNPYHPLTIELKRLHTIAIARAKKVIEQAGAAGTPLIGKLEKIGSGRPYRGDYKGTHMFYGLTDLREFMAEAMTRASFQRMLLHSEKFAEAWQTLRATTNKMIETIGKMFGLKMKDTSLLGSIMDLTQKITEAQATERKGMYEERPSPAEEEDPFNPKPKPGFHVAVGKIEGYADQAIKTFAPEALGPEAKTAGATIAKNIAKQMQSDSMHSHQAAARRSWWIKNPDMIRGFIEKAEKGERLKNPFMEKGRREYERQNKAIAAQDKAAGFEYDERDHYMAHIFEDGQKAVDVIRAKYGKKWGDPFFIKDRMWEMYEDAIKAGVRPKYTNPEDIMLARWHASDIAKMRVDSLREMENFGVAKLMTKEDHAPPEYPATQWRSPNGDWYWVHNDAYAVMSNAFDSKSLWEVKGLGGDLFRGAMGLKNRIVPIKLALSLFHPLHVATIDNATAMVRASKELLSGESNPLKWAGQMISAALYGGKSGIPFSALYDNPHQGNRLLKLWQGKLKDHQVTDADRQALTYMFEGGLIPEMSAQFRTNSKRLFKDALDKQSAVVVFHAPFAALEATQGIMFDKWIPSLKIASFLKDVETALKTDPSLIDDQARRQIAFRRIAKSIDNRYGEMAYNTLFWNKMVKDLAVVNTLSLGWNLGFLREYGGGALDIGQFMRQGGKMQAIKEGKLDRPMFVLFYSAQALAYAGLMTWAFSGKPPQETIDYIYPQTGGNDKDGKPNRANTMFYPREFYAVAKHIQAKGWFAGLSEAVLNKVAPMIGMVRDGATGVNSMHQQIRDPNANEFKQVEQTLVALWGEGKPISMVASGKHAGWDKRDVLAYSGFGPAPKYATDTPTEGKIKALYDKTYAQQETPYMQVEKSKDAKTAKEAYMAGDAKYDDLMEAMKQKFDPDDRDPKFESKLTKAWNKEDSGEAPPPAAKLFQRMYWEDQQRLLDGMTEEEREIYLPFSNKTYLRDNYEPPEKRKRH
jgi:hypothetical protein